jgi:hypothetical protein
VAKSLGGLEGLEDGQGDAVRHAAFMCAVTRLIGQRRRKLLAPTMKLLMTTSKHGKQWISPTMLLGAGLELKPRVISSMQLPRHSLNCR